MVDNHNVSQPLNSSSLTLFVLGPDIIGPAMLGSKIAVARGLIGNQLDMLIY